MVPARWSVAPAPTAQTARHHDRWRARAARRPARRVGCRAARPETAPRPRARRSPAAPRRCAHSPCVRAAETSGPGSGRARRARRRRYCTGSGSLRCSAARTAARSSGEACSPQMASTGSPGTSADQQKHQRHHAGGRKQRTAQAQREETEPARRAPAPFRGRIGSRCARAERRTLSRAQRAYSLTVQNLALPLPSRVSAMSPSSLASLS